VRLVAGATGVCVVNTIPLPHLGPGTAELGARGHALGDHLEPREDGVTLVEVVDVDVEPELAERTDAADAEEISCATRQSSVGS